MTDILKEIDVLIRARYPILYIVSWEEDRVTEALAKIGSDRGKKTFVWTIDRGILPYGTPSESEKLLTATKDPLNALDSVVKSVEPAIYVFKDIHPFLNDPVIVRKLRNLAFILTKSHKNIVSFPRFLNSRRNWRKMLRCLILICRQLKNWMSCSAASWNR